MILKVFKVFKRVKTIFKCLKIIQSKSEEYILLLVYLAIFSTFLPIQRDFFFSWQNWRLTSSWIWPTWTEISHNSFSYSAAFLIHCLKYLGCFSDTQVFTFSTIFLVYISQLQKICGHMCWFFNTVQLQRNSSSVGLS